MSFMSPHHTIEIHLQFLGTRNTDNKRSSVKTCCFGEGEMLINWTFTICHCCMSPHHTIEIHLQFLGTRNTDNKRWIYIQSPKDFNADDSTYIHLTPFPLSIIFSFIYP
ncbi:uncharacterized protein [Zea mays]|uniref:uncharacterized protein isoform X3 n=1 Tax=Zea mays TaxID=4577 RepID=UPI0009AA9EE5|nr:uncharacterized protein LOC109941998 isoform X3 [Zea mays]|eukprot:XP_020398939.1 uncharacterized protein LOC109941998 isoform X3 [Zea mays]